MSAKDTGGQAFPESQTIYGGMTLRDYFAAQAMNGVISNRESQERLREEAKIVGMDTITYIAQASYELADAMLEARKS